MTTYYMACDSTQHGDKKPGGKGWRLLSESWHHRPSASGSLKVGGLRC